MAVESGLGRIYKFGCRWARAVANHAEKRREEIKTNVTRLKWT